MDQQSKTHPSTNTDQQSQDHQTTDMDQQSQSTYQTWGDLFQNAPCIDARPGMTMINTETQIPDTGMTFGEALHKGSAIELEKDFVEEDLTFWGNWMKHTVDNWTSSTGQQGHILLRIDTDPLGVKDFASLPDQVIGIPSEGTFYELLKPDPSDPEDWRKWQNEEIPLTEDYDTTQFRGHWGGGTYHTYGDEGFETRLRLIDPSTDWAHDVNAVLSVLCTVPEVRPLEARQRKKLMEAAKSGEGASGQSSTAVQ